MYMHQTLTLTVVTFGMSMNNSLKIKGDYETVPLGPGSTGQGLVWEIGDVGGFEFESQWRENIYQ